MAMEVASTPELSIVCLSVVLFFLSLSSSYAISHGLNHDPATSPHLYSHAQKLIRSLNIFPEESINIIEDDHAGFVPGQIVEKNFSFLGHSGPSVEELGHHAGYYSLPRSKAARMFYFFFESRKNKNDPVVIWLTGGPGCASELALFYENGPFHITKILSLTWNDYGWDQASNIIFVDQPTGTGFSYSSDKSDLRHDETGVSNDLYDFLQAFFKAHPEFVKNEFYITGESYAGHYIPALASRINQNNKIKQGIHINLKGFAIESRGGRVCEDALDACEAIFDRILSIVGDLNYYDIRMKCVGLSCYDFSDVVELLNEEKVKSALGVRKELKYAACSGAVYDAMHQDTMKNLEVLLPGNLRWVNAMNWSGLKAFRASPTLEFVVDGAEAGTLNSYGPLSFLKVHEAGHLVPMDQPKAALQMLERWMGGKLMNSTLDN
ncbi:Serine carboxypeptidase-like 48 [Vigna angularis]|uniref:Carboxypeptidase n=1 Tax=Phaseolus angularis TaxID=3914 RepID=A0A8T0KD62_PHAAN|nr:Serine carboxypeptidase-like 48 [Vigna angularis]